MLLERFIIWMAEKKLAPYRVHAELVKKEKAAEYKKYQPEITRLYQQTTHWHGTGRFRYERMKDAPYEGERGNTTFDVLFGIIDSGGYIHTKTHGLIRGERRFLWLQYECLRVHLHEYTLTKMLTSSTN